MRFQVGQLCHTVTKNVPILLCPCSETLSKLNLDTMAFGARGRLMAEMNVPKSSVLLPGPKMVPS